MVVIVGSIALDTIETPFEKKEYVAGGSCFYASLSASFFTDVKIVGVVGEDFPDKYFKILKEKDIDFAGVKKEKGKTFHWHGKYNYDMQTRETIKTELNVFETFEPEIPENYKDAKYLFLANIDPFLQLKILNSMKNLDFVISDTMNFWIDIKKNELIEVFKKSNCVVLNDEEIRQFTKKTNLILGAKEILKLGPSYVIIKKGEHGATLIGKNLYFSIPSYPVENVVDPTGAGDSFAGAFIGYIAKNNKVNDDIIKKALVYANTVASFTVEDFSIQRLLNLSMQKIEERISTLRQITQF